MEPEDLSPLADQLRRVLTDIGPMPLTPDVSARLIRETASAHPDLPPGLIAAVLRQIEAAARPLMISAFGPGSEALAAARFGWRARIAMVADARAAVASCRAGARAVIAVDTRDAWWARLLTQPELSVIDDDLKGDAGRPGQFVVARQWAEPSGHDRTWWLTDSTQPPSAIEAALGELGLAGRHALDCQGLRLFALSGYVQREDERLLQAPGRLTGVIGAVPLTAA